MGRSIVAATAIFFVACVGPSYAADADVLRAFGLFGRLAIDCAAPTSAANANFHYDVSKDGKLTVSRQVSAAAVPSFAIRNVRQLAPDRIEFVQTGRTSDFTVTMVKIGDGFRSWRSVQSDGTVLISDGKIVREGQPTVVIQACGFVS